MTAPTKQPKSARWTQFNGFIDLTLRTLTPSEVRTWLVLYRDVKKTGVVRTGQTDIATRSGLSVRMVRYALAGLVRKGVVKVVRPGRFGCGPTTYRVRGFVPSG